MQAFLMELSAIAPSQVYISQAKLERLKNTAFKPLDYRTNEPLPIQKLGDVIFFTDGHTRALLYHQNGVRHIPVHWDEDELDIRLYAACLEWCGKQNIHWIGDLAEQIIPHEEYVEVWIERCQKVAERLATEQSQ